MYVAITAIRSQWSTHAEALCSTVIMPQATNSTPDSDVIVDDSRLDLIRYIDPARDGNKFVYNWTHIDDVSNDLIYNRTFSSCLQAGSMVFFTFHGMCPHSSHSSIYGGR